MTAEEIISNWKRGATHPVYWLEGEEPYYIDTLTHHAEHDLITADQASFNLTIFYGKDAKVEEVLNACRRYPMFSERQVVILKEAQQMKDLEKLDAYIQNPLASTIFVVAHKEKKIDGRGKLAKLLKQHAVVFTDRKLYDNELPEWTSSLGKQKGLDITSKALFMLIAHIGNDLQRIDNELEKLMLNLKGRKQVTEDDIEEYIGVSKEFNVFELQSALVRRDLVAALNVLNYFASNPKAAPIQLVLPILYSFFSKLYVAAVSPSKDEYSISAALGIKGFFAKQYLQALNVYSFADVEKVLLLLHHYNLKGVGVDRNNDTDDASLMKELVVKIVMQDQ